MNNPIFNKKLKSYSALAASFAIASQADAQVVYTDINPDSTVALDGNFYNLDLNNDGTADFAINVNIGTSLSYTSQQISVSPIGTNAVAGSSVGAYIYPFAMNSGDTVKPSLQFNLTPNQSMASYFGPSTSYGNWMNVTDKYLGLKFSIGPAVHYGWARLDVTATADQFIIKDYAYNTIANAYILAGQTGVGIAEHSFNDIVSIYSAGKNITINFVKELPAGSEVNITNILGQKIYGSLLNSKENTINLSEANPGMYIVSVSGKNGVYTKKVYLK
jgi:hypothetical protein